MIIENTERLIAEIRGSIGYLSDNDSLDRIHTIRLDNATQSRLDILKRIVDYVQANASYSVTNNENSQYKDHIRSLKPIYDQFLSNISLLYFIFPIVFRLKKDFSLARIRKYNSLAHQSKKERELLFDGNSEAIARRQSEYVQSFYHIFNHCFAIDLMMNFFNKKKQMC